MPMEYVALAIALAVFPLFAVIILAVLEIVLEKPISWLTDTNDRKRYEDKKKEVNRNQRDYYTIYKLLGESRRYADKRRLVTSAKELERLKKEERESTEKILRG